VWLNDLRIVLPDRIIERGAIQIKHGHIKAIVEGSGPDNGTPMDGLIAIPGLIDLHGDMLERDVEPRPNARFPAGLGLIELDKRLAGAGITTAYAAISFSWKRDDIRSQENAVRLIDAIHDLNDRLLVDMRVHARFEVNNPLTGPVLSELLDAKKVQLVSIMDHTPGQGQYGDVDRYLDFMRRWLGVDLTGVDDDLQERLITALRSKITAKVEEPRDWNVIADVMRVALAHNIPVASHDDDTLLKVREQAEMGVTISEFPVTVEAARAARDHGMHVIMGAPNAYRGQSTSNNLSAMDAIRAGLVDILATDYYPAAMLHTAFKLAKDGIMPLVESVKLVSTNAADAMHLSDRGRIEEGLSADLVLVEDGPDYPRVRGTIRHGVPIYWDAHLAKLSQVLRLPH